MFSSDDELNRMISDANDRAHRGRLDRLRFLLSYEDEGPAPVDALANEYYEEARLCWYMGAFVATIVMSQLAFEEILCAYYRRWKSVGGKLNEHMRVDDAGFADLIKQAESDGWLTHAEAAVLDRIRRDFRNPYVHPHDVHPQGRNESNKLPKRDFVTQFVKITAPQLCEGGAEDEARETIRTLVGSFRKISRRFWGMK